MNAPANPPTGVVAGRYHVLREIGAGGVAAVYLAEDTLHGGRVALKFFPPVAVSSTEFRREAAQTPNLRHPGLVQLLDAGVHDGSPFLVLEHVDGSDVRDRLLAGPIAPEVVLDWMGQVFDALEALHRAGLAHGDIKPENILVADGRARLVDYGRARLRFLMDGQGVFPGTGPYMHPDLFAGGLPSPQTDCFAAWVTTWELLAGYRPFSAATLRWTAPGTVPGPAPLADGALSAVVCAGILGRYPTARRSWLALQRYRRGRRDVLPPMRAPGQPDPSVVLLVRGQAAAGRSVAVVGPEGVALPVLEAVHRGWVGTAVWASSDWASPAVPLSGALALVGRLGDSLHGEGLAAARVAVGPLARILANACPPARAWLGEPPPDPRPATPELLVAAIRRAVLAVPAPRLCAVAGIDRLDGPSRRLFAQMAASGDAVVVASAPSGAPHGLAGQVVVDAATDEADHPVHALAEAAGNGGNGEQPAPAGSPAEPFACMAARVLALPFGPLLAEATGVSASEIDDAALESESAELARYTGGEVVPAPGAPVDPDVARAILGRAARALALDRWPLHVARYAAAAADRERLAEAIAPAFDAALAVDPAEAVRLDALDPRPPTAARLLRTLHAAVIARDMSSARALLDRISAAPDVAEADRAEAEAEYLFRLGRTREAIAAYRRVARALGRPVHEGWRGVLSNLGALFRVALGREVSPRPDERLARVFERLHDLYFATDHRPMLAVHHLWLQAAPDQPRARVMDVVWKTALGQQVAARQVEERLVAAYPEHRDPVGAAVVTLHRAIAELWRGETGAAFSGSVDACERLLRAGDPYQAALASAVMTAAGLHLGSPGPLARLADELESLANLVGDGRALGWLAALRGVVAMQSGDEAAVGEHLKSWIADARSREEGVEAVALRVYADWRLQRGEWRASLDPIQRGMALARQAHLQLDLTMAFSITSTVAMAQGSIADRVTGRRGDPDVAGMRRLLRRSPRWDARVEAAQGWSALARGDRGGARSRFAAGVELALARRQVFDAWLILGQQARALGDTAAATEAVTLARAHGLHLAAPRSA